MSRFKRNRGNNSNNVDQSNNTINEESNIELPSRETAHEEQETLLSHAEDEHHVVVGTPSRRTSPREEEDNSQRGGRGTPSRQHLSRDNSVASRGPPLSARSARSGGSAGGDARGSSGGDGAGGTAEEANASSPSRGRVHIISPLASPQISRKNVPTLQIDTAPSTNPILPTGQQQDGIPSHQADGDNTQEGGTGTGAADVKELRQDVEGQYNRLQRLRQLQDGCGLSCFTRWFHWFGLGYDINDYHRLRSFQETNKGLDLRRDTHGMTVSVIIENIETYCTYITGLIKPVVRIHAVALDSGLYVKSAERSPAPPVYTKPQLSIHSGSSAHWHQELTFDAHYHDIVSENTLLLFEILDKKPSLSLDPNMRAKKTYLRKIAWGYLLPVGSYGQLNVGFGSQSMSRVVASGGGGGNTARNSSRQPGTGRSVTPAPPTPGPSANRPFHLPLRIQLHYYRQYDGLVGLMQRAIVGWPSLSPRYHTFEDPAYPNAVPSVYLQWRLLQKLPIQGAYLNISIGPKIVRARTPRSPALHALADVETEDSLSPRSKGVHDDTWHLLYERLRRKKKRALKTLSEANVLRAAALRRLRRPDEGCAIPDKFLRRLDVGPEGAMVIKFSHSGHLLAIGSRYDSRNAPLYHQDMIYSLILYNTDTDEEIWADHIAHHSVIYDIQWSKNDRYLLTTSGDDLIERNHRLSSNQQMTAENTVMNASRDNIVLSPLHEEESSSITGKEEITRHDILSQYPPRICDIYSLGTALYAYCGVFQDFSSTHLGNSIALYNSLHGNASFMASQLVGLPSLEEQFHAVQKAVVPRIIIGCADGRLRVYDDHKFLGFISVPVEGDGNTTSKTTTATSTQQDQDFSPHDAPINALVIDDRSKYLLSADANGDIFAWRMNNMTGWYQILRKFKRNATVNNTATAGRSLYYAQQSTLEHFDNGSVLTLAIHPIKTKSLLLVHSRQPATIKVISLATYQVVSDCEGYTGVPQAYLIHEDGQYFSAGVFFHASYSADGRYIISCNTTTSVSFNTGGGSSSNASRRTADCCTYKLLIWDTYTGHIVPSPISDLTFPYPVRSIAWHPNQHLLAVSMVGSGAAVVLYCIDPAGTVKVASEAASVIPMDTAISLRPISPPSQQQPNLNNTASTINSSAGDELAYSILDSSRTLLKPTPPQLQRPGLDGTSQVLQGTLPSSSSASFSPLPSPVPSPAAQTLDKFDRMSRAK
eukprot:scaffold2646_cov184-Ochromonas_danica.AAC.3